MVARGLLEGLYKPSKELAQVIYQCTTCGFCQYRCALDNVDFIEAFRADLVEVGLALPEHIALIEWTKRHGNPYYKRKATPEVRAAWAKGLPLRPKAETLLFAGCTYSILYPSLMRLIAMVLLKAGVDLAYLGEDELCCGSWMHRTGHLSPFNEQVEKNVRRFHQVGAHTITTMCAGCYRTLKADYPEHSDEFDMEVVSGVELIAQLIDQGKIQPSGRVNMIVTYHDPCHLGRHMRVIEEPRRILENIPGVRVVEARYSRYNSHCCGGGGGLVSAFPDLAFRVAVRRLRELEETGAEAIVTACPFCETLLRRAVRQSGSKMRVYDVVELVAWSMGLPSAEKL